MICHTSPFITDFTKRFLIFSPTLFQSHMPSSLQPFNIISSEIQVPMNAFASLCMIFRAGRELRRDDRWSLHQYFSEIFEIAILAHPIMKLGRNIISMCIFQCLATSWYHATLNSLLTYVLLPLQGDLRDPGLPSTVCTPRSSHIRIPQTFLRKAVICLVLRGAVLCLHIRRTPIN